ncbi:MAG: DNA methylase [Chloroflexi bacterium]|nr:DNA methylase [Chloroflexota bacterium]
MRPDPANPRKITETAAEKLARSMEEFGDLSGVVRNVVTNELVGGHQRVARFVADNPPVTVTERFDEATVVGTLAHGYVTWRGERWSYREVAWERAKQVAANIAANNPELQGEFDFPVLADAVAYLEGEGYDATLTGYDIGQIEQLMTWTPPENGPEEKPEPPPPAEPDSKRGVVYELDRHRLMCGDATNPDDVVLLLGDEKPRLMVTDPPYGVNYDPTWRDGVDGLTRAERSMPKHARPSPRGKRRRGGVPADDRVDWREAWLLSPSDVAYVWHGGLYASQVQESLAVARYELRAQVVWVKQAIVFGRGDYHWQHEPCWFGVRKGATSGWIGDRKQSTAWTIPNSNLHTAGAKDDADTNHATQKPLECMARPIRHHSGDVYDPFGGAGTTLIAAHRNHRRCWMMEIDPGYCDVIRARFDREAERPAAAPAALGAPGSQVA